jgi:hypothetical protein
MMARLAPLTTSSLPIALAPAHSLMPTTMEHATLTTYALALSQGPLAMMAMLVPLTTSSSPIALAPAHSLMPTTTAPAMQVTYASDQNPVLPVTTTTPAPSVTKSPMTVRAWEH